MRAPVPPDELNRALIDVAIGEVERIMLERGLSPTEVTAELLHRAVDRMWGDEDREGLRAKAHGEVSAYVDALFDGVGDDRVAA